MTELATFQVRVNNFKCFGNDEQGFDCFKPLNLIIGRNNSGKSSLLDLVEYIVNNSVKIPKSLWHKGNPPEIRAKSPLEEADIRPVFNDRARGGSIPGRNHWEFGSRLVGVDFKWLLNAPAGRKFLNIGDCLDGTRPLDRVQNNQNYLQQIADLMKNPLQGKEFRRIYAERNIVPEADSGGKLEVFGDGGGVTNIIQNFINKASLRSDLVEKTLLDELNTVFRPDSFFTDIVCQQLDNGSWEIYLEEETKGRIPLSQSGSGLKTIILVLVYIYLVPVVTKKELSEFVFGFEELENNLHPALQRRLLTYLYNCAKKENCIIFLTTHSNVEIDLFSKNPDAQIIHVTHDGEKAYSKTVKTYIDNRGILDDLDVRASDLLQANGVIWVEGPSDRIYLNRWIDIWSDGELFEGNHFQCVFYGGRLLSHLSSQDPELVEETVSILKVNKNSIILIDSDKRNRQSSLNDTKKRIIQEIEGFDGIAWVTRGREIENYISANVLNNWLEEKIDENVGQYDNFFVYLNNVREGIGDRYARKKSMLAETLSPHFTQENMRGILDIQERLDQICQRIRVWNNLEKS